MWTNTDIPPGGEGTIEVTFDTNHKRGMQTKSITVLSNDPTNGTMNLTVSANVVVDFGFEQFSVYLGRITPGQTVTQTTVLLIREPDKVKLAEVSSTSEFVSAEILPSGAPGHVEIAVTTKPGMPIGYFTAELVAKSSEDSAREARINVTATMVGNIEAVPNDFRYKLLAKKLTPENFVRTVTIKGTVEAERFQIISIEEPDSRFSFKLDTVSLGKEYKLTATLKPGVADTSAVVQGQVLVHTDDPSVSVVSIPYTVILRPGE